MEKTITMSLEEYNHYLEENKKIKDGCLVCKREDWFEKEYYSKDEWHKHLLEELSKIRVENEARYKKLQELWYYQYKEWSEIHFGKCEEDEEDED